MDVLAPTIAFLGPRGTFTEQAALDFVASGRVPGLTLPEGVPASQAEMEGLFQLLPVRSPAEALDALRNQRVDAAVVAVESSVDGPVVHTEDALITGERVQIIAETLVPIVFSIGVRKKEEEQKNAVLTTHPVAEAQIRQWVATNLPGAEFIPATSNGAAAQAVAEGKADLCAAPRRALDIYGLEAIAHDVADVAGAYTRFALVTRPVTPPPATGRDRTGVAFTLPHEPGTLLAAMQQLSMRGVNLTRIGSRPTKSLMGTYVFHVGMVGHIADPAVAEALAGLQRVCSWLRYIGSWPLADIPPEQGKLTEILSNTGAQPPDYARSLQWLDAMRTGAAEAPGSAPTKTAMDEQGRTQ